MPHWIALATVACLAWPRAALAAPTLGFVENWPGTTISGWVSGQQALSNPGTGGFSGIGDGFLELSTGLSIAYTLYVPFRFQRFADRVLGAEASKADRDALKQKLSVIGKFLIDWQTKYDDTIKH